MTDAEITEIQSLINGAKDMKKLFNEKSKSEQSEIAKIRQYMIDAINDYNNTKNQLIAIINANRDLFSYNQIAGTRVNDKKYPYEYFTGSIGFGKLTLRVRNIKGKVIAINTYPYSKDEIEDYSNWECYDIETKSTNDLIHSKIYCQDGKQYEWNETNLYKFNWTIDGWIANKAIADNTRKATVDMVSSFKTVLNQIINNHKEKINSLTATSDNCNYVKVAM